MKFDMEQTLLCRIHWEIIIDFKERKAKEEIRYYVLVFLDSVENDEFAAFVYVGFIQKCMIMKSIFKLPFVFAYVTSLCHL